MPTWLNKDLVAYHGTDDVAVGAQHLPVFSTLALFVNLSLCRPFVLTTRSRS